MKQRLQKIISTSGAASRRAAEEMIESGRVAVNGNAATLGQSADPEEDLITIDGVPLAPPAGKKYIMLNKPRGYVTTLSDEKGRKTVADLVSGTGIRLYPVGRLDMYSEGLLIMTNDGEAANKLMHPSHNIKKVYHAWVRGNEIAQATDMLRGDMIIDGYKVRSAQVEVLSAERDSAVLSITIGEGRNRQIRKMCELAGLSVQRLRRVAEGGLKLGELASGKWRYLTDVEIEELTKDNIDD